MKQVSVKNRYYLLTVILVGLLLGCGEDLIERPKNLIPQGEMTDILYDLSLLEAMGDTYPGTLEDNDIEVMELIFEKYGIDSAQYTQSDRYYASQPHLYEEIYQNLHDRLKNQRDSISEILSPSKVKDSTRSNKP